MKQLAAWFGIVSIVIAGCSGSGSSVAAGGGGGPAPKTNLIAFAAFSTSASVQGVYLMNSDGTSQTRIYSGHASQPKLSPDGKFVAFSDAGKIYIMDRTGSLKTSFATNSSYMSWNPDCKRLVFIDATNALKTIDVTTGTVVALGVSGFFPIWTTDGAKVLYEGTGGTLNRVDANGSNKLTLLSKAGLAFQTAAMSPDGSKIAVLTLGGNLSYYVCNADGTGLKQVSTQTVQAFYSACWSADSQFLYGGGVGPDQGKLFRFALDGTTTTYTDPAGFALIPLQANAAGKIAVQAGKGIDSNVATINPDLTGYKTLTSAGVFGSYPSIN